MRQAQIGGSINGELTKTLWEDAWMGWVSLKVDFVKELGVIIFQGCGIPKEKWMLWSRKERERGQWFFLQHEDEPEWGVTQGRGTCWAMFAAF